MHNTSHEDGTPKWMLDILSCFETVCISEIALAGIQYKMTHWYSSIKCSYNNHIKGFLFVCCLTL